MTSDTGVTDFDLSLGSGTRVVPRSCITSEEEKEGSAETSDNDGKKTEMTDKGESALETASFFDNLSDTKPPNSIPDVNGRLCPANKPSESLVANADPPPKLHNSMAPAAADKANTLPSSSISPAGTQQTQQETFQELLSQSGQSNTAPSAPVSPPTRSYPVEEKQLLMVDTSVNSSGSLGPAVFTAKRQKEILLARKARKDKFFSRVTFSNPDNKYYSHLPVQPAMGWWKSVLSSRSHSLQFASRLARSLNVPIPDTVYSCSTDCFYVSTRPDALQTKTDADTDLRGQVPASNGWYIRSEFSAAKLLEGNLAARLSQEQRKYSRFSQEISTFPSVATCPASPTNQNGGNTNRKRAISFRTAQSQKFDVAGRTSRPLPSRENPRSTSGFPPAAVSNSPLAPPDTYPAAVVKQLHYLRKDCNITKALDLTTFSTISSDTSVERLYQAFVRGRQRSRCQLTRVCWNASRAPSGFTLVNKFTPSGARQHGGDLTSQYCVSCDNPTLNGVSRTCEEEERRSADHSETSFDVVPVAGSSLEAAADIARAIFHFTQNLFKLWLDSLVVDLIRSVEDGAWYFLQVKSFTLRPASPSALPTNFSSGKGETFEDGEEEWTQERGGAHVQDLARYSIPTVCHMCGLRRKKHELVKVVNQRMMLETQHHMRKRGLDVLFFTPGGRLQLSSNCPVCSLCYSLYLAEKELIEVELELARALRQPMVKDNEVFFSFTGVMDAIQHGSVTQHYVLTVTDLEPHQLRINTQVVDSFCILSSCEVRPCCVFTIVQCTLQPNDPYLLDLLRSFSNAPPRQISFDRLEPGGTGGRIDLQICPVRDRDSVLSFGTVSDERSRGTIESVASSPAGPPQRKPILRIANTVSGASSSPVEAAGASAPSKFSPSAPLSSCSNSVHSGSNPETGSAAATLAVSAAGAAGREDARFSGVPSSTRGPSTVPRSIPIGSTLVAPPKKTMRGGEAVTSTNGVKDEKWRQIPTKLYQWRMMLFLHSLQDLPRGLLQPQTSASKQQQHAENLMGEETSELVIELKIFGESRVVALHSSQISADSVAAARSRSATGMSSHCAAAAYSGRTRRTQSSESASAAAVGAASWRDSPSGMQGYSIPSSSAVAEGACRSSVNNPRSAQYVPIKRMIVFYLFSTKPCLQQIFQREALQFRLLASSRAAASAEAESSCWCTCASSPPLCSLCPLPTTPACFLTPFTRVDDAPSMSTAAGYPRSTAACYETSDCCSPLCISSAASSSCNSLPGSTARSCIHSSSCSHSCATLAAQPGPEKPSRPRSAALEELTTSSTPGRTSGAGRAEGIQACSECGRCRRPPCLHAAAESENESGSATETGRPSRSQSASDKRASTASPGALGNSQRIRSAGKLYSGAAAECTRSKCRPASAAATPLDDNGREHANFSRSPHTRPSNSPVGRYGNFCEVAAGSCSLQRLAGMRCSKQQTYVLLFSKTFWAQPRLRLVLGLHQDMQIPSQYVCVHPYADAYLPTRPYTSPCPLPSEWLDCYSAPSSGSSHANTSHSSPTSGRRGSALARTARPVSAYMQPRELHTSERIICTARRPL